MGYRLRDHWRKPLNCDLCPNTTWHASKGGSAIPAMGSATGWKHGCCGRILRASAGGTGIPGHRSDISIHISSAWGLSKAIVDGRFASRFNLNIEAFRNTAILLAQATNTFKHLVVSLEPSFYVQAIT